jgi:hypothetical protein
MAARKDSQMKPSDNSDLAPAPDHFATGNVAEGQDLKWRIEACFKSRIPEIQGIHVTVFGGSAVLRGKVRSSQEKRLCLECCRHVPGVTRVVDDLSAPADNLICLASDDE